MAEPLISPWRAWALAERGRIQLIDVREPDEVELPRVAGARLIPLDDLPDALVTLDRERPVAFLSARGGRAIEAVGVLRSAGVTAHAIEGGVREWVEAGLPLERRTPGGPSAFLENHPASFTRNEHGVCTTGRLGAGVGRRQRSLPEQSPHQHP